MSVFIDMSYLLVLSFYLLAQEFCSGWWSVTLAG